MAIFSNTAEGQASGTTVSAANSGGASGDAFSIVQRNTNDIMFTSSQSMHGQQSYYFGLNSTITSYVVWNGFSTTQIASHFYFKLGALPNSALRLWEINDGASYAAARLLINSSNRFLLQTSNGTVTAKLFTTTLIVDTWYRVEIAASTGTSNATLKMDYYIGDSMTTVEAGLNSTTTNTGTTSNLSEVIMGSGAASSTLNGAMWMDDLRIETGTLTYAGPSGSGQASTVWFSA